MDNAKEVKKKKFKMRKSLKRGLLIPSALILLIIVGVTCILLLGDNENALTNELESMGISFYEDYYYDMLKEKYNDDEESFKEYLSIYKEQGFKIDLDNLSIANNMQDKLEDFINSKTKENCDKNKTMVIIYPKEDYGKKDYTMDVILVCGFDETEK